MAGGGGGGRGVKGRAIGEKKNFFLEPFFPTFQRPLSEKENVFFFSF